MNVPNLAMMFGPTIMRSPEGRDLLDLAGQAKTVSFLISHYADIF